MATYRCIVIKHTISYNSASIQDYCTNQGVFGDGPDGEFNCVSKICLRPTPAVPKITRNSYYTSECDFRSKPAGGKINPGGGERKSPSGVQARSPGGGLGDEVPQKPKDSKKNTGKILMF